MVIYCGVHNRWHRLCIRFRYSGKIFVYGRQEWRGGFLIPYFIAVAFFGIPLMILEFTMGRHYRTSVVSSFSAIRKRFRWVGLFIVFISSMILSYYLVMTSWVLAYFLFFLLDKQMAFSEFTSSYYPLIFYFIPGMNIILCRGGSIYGNQCS